MNDCIQMVTKFGSERPCGRNSHGGEYCFEHDPKALARKAARKGEIEARAVAAGKQPCAHEVDGRACKLWSEPGAEFCKVHSPEGLEETERTILARAAEARIQLLTQTERFNRIEAERRADRAQVEKTMAEERACRAAAEAEIVGLTEDAKALLTKARDLALHGDGDAGTAVRIQALTELAKEIRLATGGAVTARKPTEKDANGRASRTREWV